MSWAVFGIFEFSGRVGARQVWKFCYTDDGSSWEHRKKENYMRMRSFAWILGVSGILCHASADVQADGTGTDSLRVYIGTYTRATAKGYINCA